MLIQQKRVLTLSSKLAPQLKEQLFRVVSAVTTETKKLQELGFSFPLVVGESILPSNKFGPSCRFNADGREIPIKDRPMETMHRTQVWHRTEYHGRDNPVETSSLVSISYQRYPRKLTLPPEVRLTVRQDNNGNYFATTDLYSYGTEDTKLLAAINVMLEIFGACEVQKEDGSLLKPPHIVFLDWELLPTGQYPWERVKDAIRKSFQGTRPQVLAAIEYRIDFMKSLNPTSIGVGKGGFSGYVVFCFPERELYILESRRKDNATYILSGNWKEISELTKAQILHGNLHERRIIHNDYWQREVQKLFLPIAKVA